MRSLLGTAQAGLFQPCEDKVLAASLHASGAEARALSSEHLAAHALAIRLDVVRAPVRFPAGRRVGSRGARQTVERLLFEILAAGFGPVEVLDLLLNE